MSDVFLSYAREDLARAKTIAEALAARGWTVFWDRKISPGLSFEDVIERELTSAKAVMVLWSASSTASSWVRNEAADAGERGKLVPVLIESVKLPIGFRHMQTSDLSAWDGVRPSTEWEAVIERIAELHGRPAAKGAAAPPRPPQPEREPTRPGDVSPAAATSPPAAPAITPPLRRAGGWPYTRVAIAGGAIVVGLLILGAILSQIRPTSDDSADLFETLPATDSSSASGAVTDAPAAGSLESSLGVSAASGAYGAQALSPGFSPDPFTIAVKAGGALNLSSLSSGTGCVGWAAVAPDFVVDLTGSTPQLRFYATSATDTALVVLDPAGGWHCDDDGGGSGNPDVTVTQAEPGSYRVWVTTYSQGNADATLHVSEFAAAQAPAPAQ